MRSVHTSASTQLHFWLSASLPCLGVSSTFDSSSCFVIDSTHPPSWRAFAPPALPGFFTTTPPLTSAGLLPDRPFADLLALRNFPPFHLQPPQGLPFSRYPSGCPCQVSLPFELRHFPAGSLSPLSRIEFVSYRLVVLLRLLPTPPHDDAVAVEYGPENVCPVGTFTLLFKCAYERTGRTLRGPNRFAARRPLPLFAHWKIPGANVELGTRKYASDSYHAHSSFA